MQTTDEGTYLEVEGRPAVRFERIYPQSVDRVWRAISEPDQIAHWFPSPEVSLDPLLGGGQPQTVGEQQLPGEGVLGGMVEVRDVHAA